MGEPAARRLDVALLDCMYREADKLYHEVASGCGLSDCAYWMLYEVVRKGGATSMSDLVETWCFSRQTISSAVKSLERVGLVSSSFASGSRKRKVVVLTEPGRAFAERRIVPAMEAEQRAFESLPVDERRELLRLVEKYTRAIDAELSSIAGRASGDETKVGRDD